MFVWFLLLLITYIGGHVLRLSLYKWKRWPALLVITLYVDWVDHEAWESDWHVINNNTVILSEDFKSRLYCRSCQSFVFHVSPQHFIMLFMCSVLSAAWYHCPVGVWPVVCRKQVHSVPPLTPKSPSSIAPHSTSSSSWLFVVSFFHHSI